MSKLRQGFTLVEVILAIALFAMAAGILVEIVFNINFALEQLESQVNREADIRFVRRTVLAIADREKLEDGDEIRTLSSGNATWEAEIEETEVVDLFMLKLSITFDDEDSKDEPHIYQLYVLRQGWSQATERSALLSEKRSLIEGNRNF